MNALLRVLVLTSLFTLSSAKAQDQRCLDLKRNYSLTVCIGDEVVDLNSISSGIQSRDDYVHGLVIQIDEAHQRVVIEYKMYNGMMPAPLLIRRDVFMNAIAKIQMPIAGKYPNDFYQGSEIIDTLTVGKGHPGFFITEAGLIDLSKKVEIPFREI